jgi:hypothetical protein
LLRGKSSPCSALSSGCGGDGAGHELASEASDKSFGRAGGGHRDAAAVPFEAVDWLPEISFQYNYFLFSRQYFAPSETIFIAPRYLSYLFYGVYGYYSSFTFALLALSVCF